MAEDVENFENEGGSVEPEAVETEAPPASWSGPSEEEWKTLVAATSQVYGRLMEPPQEEEEPDYEEMDLPTLVKTYTDNKFNELKPYAERFAEEQGRARLAEMHKGFKKEFGEFDSKVAEHNAVALLPQLNWDAEAAAKEGARMAAEYRKQERQAAIEEYKASLKRQSFDDPSVGGAGERSATPAKTYEEVISRWSGDEEV